MQTPATLLDFISTWDIAIFFAVPLLLMITAFLQEYLAWRASQDHHGSPHPTAS
jgi:hypothetical protein